MRKSFHVAVPFYEQTFDFTCGPACLMMALHHLDPSIPMEKGTEIDIWREANMVEIRGTSPQGLALAAHRRGFGARIVSNKESLPLRDLIIKRRPEVNIEVLDLFYEDLRKKCAQAGIPHQIRVVRPQDLWEALSRGGLPILLTSTRISADEHIPHWILITGWDDSIVYVNNPYVPHGNRADSLPMEVLLENLGFEGDQGLVVVSRRRSARGT
jgi:hypothetical protein